jgi:hypothetical protein
MILAMSSGDGVCPVASLTKDRGFVLPLLQRNSDPLTGFVIIGDGSCKRASTRRGAVVTLPLGAGLVQQRPSIGNNINDAGVLEFKAQWDMKSAPESSLSSADDKMRACHLGDLNNRADDPTARWRSVS